MYTDILINAAPYENRIALVESGNLLELHIERPAEKGLVGNIYRGKVVRVLPGMQAAFVDIGLDRTGFLYVDDIHISMSQFEQHFIAEEPCTSSYARFLKGEEESSYLAKSALGIEQLVKEGQSVLVQIAKDPLGTKGARLTCHITLPCRNLVFMPLTNHIGISRKIGNEATREALRKKIDSLRPPGTGFIVRTVAEDITTAELEADMEFLLLLWDEIRCNAQKNTTVPGLVYRDIDLVLKSVRDLFNDNVNELVIDSAAEHSRLLEFVSTFAPRLKNRVVYYDGEIPLFEAYGIENAISRASDKKVWLRSGGYIIIETTEALTVVDVNTGRYVGKNDLGETIFKTNMEAVKEIAAQLRLRNIGGIIIIDFIDMENESCRESLYKTLQEAMSKDRNRLNILKISEFGLVQMTRQRSCENLSQILHESCPTCNGEGRVKSGRTICYDLFRKITRDAHSINGSSITLRVHPRIANFLQREEAVYVAQLEQSTGKRFNIIPVPELYMQRYEIIWNE